MRKKKLSTRLCVILNFEIRRMKIIIFLRKPFIIIAVRENAPQHRHGEGLKQLFQQRM